MSHRTTKTCGKRVMLVMNTAVSMHMKIEMNLQSSVHLIKSIKTKVIFKPVAVYYLA